MAQRETNEGRARRLMIRELEATTEELRAGNDRLEKANLQAGVMRDPAVVIEQYGHAVGRHLLRQVHKRLG